MARNMARKNEAIRHRKGNCSSLSVSNTRSSLKKWRVKKISDKRKMTSNRWSVTIDAFFNASRFSIHSKYNCLNSPTSQSLHCYNYLFVHVLIVLFFVAFQEGMRRLYAQIICFFFYRKSALVLLCSTYKVNP